MPKKGFTLIEILVVMMVLSIIGVLFLNIITRTLRANNKSQIIGLIKQNGQAVLENIDKTVRDADSVICPVSTSPDTRSLVVKKGGLYTRYRFVPASASINGSIQSDNPIKQLQIDTGLEETDQTFINRVCQFTDPLQQLVILTDTNPKNGVSVENGTFTRNTLAGFKDQVTIKFDLEPGIAAPAAIAGIIDPITFTTTIQLR